MLELSVYKPAANSNEQKRKDENTLTLMSFSFEIHLIELGFLPKSEMKISSESWWEINFQNPFPFQSSTSILQQRKCEILCAVALM